MRGLPSELSNIDCDEIRKAVAHAALFAAANWEVSPQEAYDEVLARLVDNRVSRKSVVSAKRYLRDIPEQEYS